MMPDPDDYDFTDPADVAWFRHDVRMAAHWFTMYGDDEPERVATVLTVGPDRRN